MKGEQNGVRGVHVCVRGRSETERREGRTNK